MTTSVSIAWAACPRWAVRESADIIDVIEQPAGQTCAVMVDVQGTGSSPRRLGNALMHEARSLLAGGVAPDLVAQTLNQLLHSWREGQVGATIVLSAISVARRRAEIAGYGDAAMSARCVSDWSCQELRSVLAGHDPGAEPERRVMSLENGALVVLSSDGLARTSGAFLGLITAISAAEGPAGVVDQLVEAAIRRDHGRPSADMAAIAIQIIPEQSEVAVDRGRLIRPVRSKAARQ